MPEIPHPAATRPLSPHLQIYRPQITSTLSILHRLTGIGLCLVMPVLVLWLVALSQGPDMYHAVMTLIASPVGKLLLFGWSWALCFHLCAGVRHLVWDIGYGFDLPQMQASGWAVVLLSTVMTAFLWLYILRFAS